jgi:CRISPR-associated protein Csx14
MSEIRIPLDPMNPGQFFACCGLFALLAPGGEDVLARFEVDEQTPRRATFVVQGAQTDLPSILKQIREANSESLKPEAGEAPEETVLPVGLSIGEQAWRLDWWLDEFWDKTTNLKCWAGQVRSRILLSELLALVELDTPADKLFAASAMTKSKYGIDPRSAWNALDFGFSPNEHNKDAATYPMVEIFGCMGLQAFRPVLHRRRASYHLWQEYLPVTVARLAAFLPWKGLPCLQYEFLIEKRGQSYKFFAFAKFEGRK